ncbi:LuxR C-terminal-related transcriptional regulator [Ulvibacterium sp.]|uniref:LuxR C-terminal-related transcriptional regulator n=1 Tax=Ulvibacterium sp. TaxID=2665914 RepID=UPI002617454B|nr:LuxR C-terminal-related transcriptional regulator [Ulvibacterium sp.]
MANKTLKQPIFKFLLIDVPIGRNFTPFVTQNLYFYSVFDAYYMSTKTLFFLLFFIILKSQGQYRFDGQINLDEGKTVYLSYIEDYRKLSRIYIDQIIRKTEVDSLGRFSFKGTNLPEENRIYRLHLDGCDVESKPNPHILGVCDFSQSVLFIANNSDTLNFSKSPNGQTFCQIASTNPSSDDLLQIESLKEEMIVDFNDFNSEANRKINSEKWFTSLQEFGLRLNEPLAELFIYDFLSDRRNETYSYYLKDLNDNLYYDHLLERLKKGYPETAYTQLYENEIHLDEQIASGKDTAIFTWKWILAFILALSLLLNLYLLFQRKRSREIIKKGILEKLTFQEQKIVHEILKEKTNKEIATDLFISVSTVKTHINNLYKKLNVSKREDIKGLFENQN